MSVSLRPVRADECAALTALCLRSKAHWGYDADFMAACRDELTVHPQDNAMLAQLDGQIAGTAQVKPQGPDANLVHFFVDPPFMGHGVGRALFDWALEEARKLGAARLMIEADPQA